MIKSYPSTLGGGSWDPHPYFQETKAPLSLSTSPSTDQGNTIPVSLGDATVDDYKGQPEDFWGGARLICGVWWVKAHG